MAVQHPFPAPAVPRPHEFGPAFGPQSACYQQAVPVLGDLWQHVQAQPGPAAAFSQWAAHLALANDQEPTAGLWCLHSYLALLAGLMVRMSMVQHGWQPDDDAIAALCRETGPGHILAATGLETSPLWGWPLVEEQGQAIATTLWSQLATYDWTQLMGDVLRPLYEAVVTARTRKGLGEVYTPDWLAERLVQHILRAAPTAAALDPASGAGTFIFHLVAAKRRLLGASPQTLEHILTSVAGIDINPLAVVMSTANLLLALGPLLRHYPVLPAPVRPRVGLADALRVPDPLPPSLWLQQPCARVTGPARLRLTLPVALLEQPAQLRLALQAVQRVITPRSADWPTSADILQALRAVGAPGLASQMPGVERALLDVAETLVHSDAATSAAALRSIEQSGWLAGLRHRFDVLVGNPPWLVYRSLANPDQQEEVRRYFSHYALLGGRAELLTNMDLATLFLFRTADAYLGDTGRVAFVLPRSIFSADQHAALRAGTFQRVPLTWQEVWDLEGVSPLFPVPACVLWGHKTPGAKPTYPVPGEQLRGVLPTPAVSWAEAARVLTVHPVQVALQRRGQRTYWDLQSLAAPPPEIAAPAFGSSGTLASPYQGRFAEGANLVPQSCWMVDPPTAGPAAGLVQVRTAAAAQRSAKPAYNGLVLEGAVEVPFLFTTLLGADMLPFGHRPFRPLVLPLEGDGQGRFCLLTPAAARHKGYAYLATWLEQAEHEWLARHAPKSRAQSLWTWLDYGCKLTRQVAAPGPLVVYPGSVAHLCACVVWPADRAVDPTGQSAGMLGYIADCSTHYAAVNDPQEALYLAAVLNAPVLDELLKPLQAAGAFGPRHIRHKVWDLPIPRYDATLAAHRCLAELGQACQDKVAAWLAAEPAAVHRRAARQQVRELLATELAAITATLTPLLQAPPTPRRVFAAAVPAAEAAPAASPYRHRFRAGASIYPQPLWFVETAGETAEPVLASPLAMVQSAGWATANAKGAWRGLVLRGAIEPQFLFATLYSADLLPFGLRGFRPMVLPAEAAGEGYRLLTVTEAQDRGLPGLAAWLALADREWVQRRGHKAERMGLLDRLDYQRGLTRQRSGDGVHRCIYAGSGAHVVAAVVPAATATWQPGQLAAQGGFMPHYKTYYLETTDADEAHYMAALLNAPCVDALIKPAQTRGEWGPRDINSKVLDLPLPQYDPTVAAHRRLAALSRQCHARIAAWLAAQTPDAGPSPAALREAVRQLLPAEFAEIDTLAAALLAPPPSPPPTPQPAAHPGSPYRSEFRLGATIYPQSLWFITPVPPDTTTPTAPVAIHSAAPATAAGASLWREVRLSGHVEPQFVFRTLRAGDLLPFGSRPCSPVLLPLEVSTEGAYRLLTRAQARVAGYEHLAAWLEQVEQVWERHRGAKAARMTVLERLNYQQGLTRQPPYSPYWVLYNVSESHLCACVVPRLGLRPADFDPARRFVVSAGMFYFPTASQEEAHYLAAVLNAPCLDALVKPGQVHGTHSPRHISSRGLDVPVPRYQGGDPTQRTLAALSVACHTRTAQWLAAGSGRGLPTATLRGRMRELVAPELREINSLVLQLLGAQTGVSLP